jgi:hypothetical protein
MSSQTTLAVAAMVLSVLSVIVSGWFSARTVRLSHALEEERDRQQAQKSALEAASRVYEPLAQAAAELQSRIYNMVKTGWVPLVERYQGHGDYAVNSTAFLFAHYFGWIEARRQAVLTSSGEGRRDATVTNCINDVRQTLRKSAFNEGFLFLNVEQRAIGELMFYWDPLGDGVRLPCVMGYAAFAKKYRDDDDFRQWFGSVGSGMDMVESCDYGRLIEIHGALLSLIKVLDPTRKYTTRYDLRPIEGTQPTPEVDPA